MTQLVWQDLGNGVYVQRQRELDLNCGLVVGQERALVIDTGSSATRGADLLASVRAITDADPVVVNTHAHYDHCFGNIAFRDAQIYAHTGAADDLISTGEQQRSNVVAMMREAGDEEFAREIEHTEIVLPFYLVETDAPLDLGGRTVQLRTVGPAHTDHDVLVVVQDAGVVFWGDLIEVGADPAMDDAFPLHWGPAVGQLLNDPAIAAATRHVPGHGEVVDLAEVRRQSGVLTDLARRLQSGVSADLPDPAGLAAGVLAAGESGLSRDTIVAAAQRAWVTAPRGESPPTR